MRFHQVRELLRWAADYHGRLEAAYTKWTGHEDVGERRRMALDYLAEHERRMRRELEEYFIEGSAHRRVLDTWFDDPEDFPHAPVLERLPGADEGEGLETLLSTALALHRTLQDLYRHRVERAASEPESEFFEALVRAEDAEVRRLVRDIQRLDAY
ncbi:2-hydroxyacyl-CoA dehydratase [Halomonas getboli]|uniref:2-hydroxyacyl-CoA dehydratase n=1 Tax=Halomonas getboli TaxID=2935862 RepID=UPI0020002C9B|nr:2-hydroxyacyl-CoA dehydratase [Halomonas getboli]MCK2183444.1 2-hydroxyacyl-CoA dehydratase [Halomonas getboli]